MVLGRLGAGLVVLVLTLVVRHGPWRREPQLWAHLALLAVVANVVPGVVVRDEPLTGNVVVGAAIVIAAVAAVSSP